MNTDKFNLLSEKLYPDKLDREDAKLAVELIVTTERYVQYERYMQHVIKEFLKAEKDYNDAEKKIRDYLIRQNSNFPGHFLIPIDKIKLDKLRELINFTFGEKLNV